MMQTLKMKRLKLMLPNGHGGKSAMSCPWVKVTESAYDFDIKKADKIFDFLLEKKQLKLSSNHVISSTGELKGKRYYKFHNATTHNTNECRVFRQHV